MEDINVYIDSMILSKGEVDGLNEADHAITFSHIQSKDFLPPEVITVLMTLSQDFAINAAYDSVKYIFVRILDAVSKKVKGQNTKFKFTCNRRKYSFECSFPLTDEQKDKIVQAAINKILADS